MPENELDILKPQVIVFDVYETMLDMIGVERKINGLTESKRMKTAWLKTRKQNGDGLSPTPDFTCKTLVELASMLTGQDKEGTN